MAALQGREQIGVGWCPVLMGQPMCITQGRLKMLMTQQPLQLMHGQTRFQLMRGIGMA